MPNLDRNTKAAFLLIALIISACSPAFAASCESLATLKLPDTTITSAQQVAAGAFVPQTVDAGLRTG